MTKRQVFSCEKLIVFSLLFLSWYGMVAFLCWNLAVISFHLPLDNPGAMKWIVYLFFNGVMAGLVLVLSALQTICFKSIWRAGTLKQYFSTGLDMLVLSSMLAFPYYIFINGYYLLERFAFSSVIVSIAVFALVVSGRCFLLIKREEVPSCAL